MTRLILSAFLVFLAGFLFLHAGVAWLVWWLGRAGLGFRFWLGLVEELRAWVLAGLGFSVTFLAVAGMLGRGGLF